jgi:hypothetical protein
MDCINGTSNTKITAIRLFFHPLRDERDIFQLNVMIRIIEKQNMLTS